MNLMKRNRQPKLASIRRHTTGRIAQTILNVITDLAISRSLDEALETMVSIMTSTIGAERGTIFLSDQRTGELYSRVAQGNFRREIRILNSSGVAGWVFTNGKSVIVNDAYNDERFNRHVDEATGFKTRSILCTPLKTPTGEIIGVSEILNKKEGDFTEKDTDVVEAITEQAAIVLKSNLVAEEIEESRRQEMGFLEMVSQISSEIQLGSLLQRIISMITNMLDAERSTLFLNDEKTQELYTEIGEGLGKTQIRFPNHLGVAGTVFTSQESVNIPHAYADLRFNPSIDRQTGFFTRSILCTPLKNKAGKTIGVTQVLNKRGGAFTPDDEARLSAFTSQISIAIENAKLFDDIQNIKNYNESMLESMSTGVITIDEDGKIVTCNNAGLRILQVEPSEILQKGTKELFRGFNKWILDKIEHVHNLGEDDVIVDAELESAGKRLSVNVTILPLISVKQEKLGSMIMIEDISTEKRLKTTMSRYMDPALADKLVEGGEDIISGTSSVATVLFSDIRSFTTLAEGLGALSTVSLLNEYFTIMVDCIQNEGGMLDKFIGDAIMAVFGTPFAHEDDPDRAIRAAVSMMTELNIYNEKRIADGNMPINHGIGINTDSVVSGNIGTPKRMDYTVIGDGVNLASRLESACKQYGASILISEYTFKALKGTYRIRRVDNVLVKGKNRPVSVYEVLDYHSGKSFPNMIEALGKFNDGVEYYIEAKWDSAIKMFSEALKLNPGDKCSAMYLDRCRNLRERPPPQGKWDGVWVMTSK
jgi:adenylate cyclase